MNVVDWCPIHDDGTIVVFSGIDEDAEQVITFGVDHRIAYDLLSLYECGEEPETLYVEHWQVLSSRKATP